MKAIFLMLLLLPCSVFAQKYNFQGEYKLVEEGKGRQVKASDTIIESFHFRDDSVRMGYLVKQGDANTPVSRYYSGYMKWKITRQEKSAETDSVGGKLIVYEQLDVTISDGPMIGYFQHASSQDDRLAKTLPPGLIFVREGREYLKVRSNR